MAIDYLKALPVDGYIRVLKVANLSAEGVMESLRTTMKSMGVPLHYISDETIAYEKTLYIVVFGNSYSVLNEKEYRERYMTIDSTEWRRDKFFD